MNSKTFKATGLDLISDWDDCPCGGRTLDKLIQPAILVVLAAGPLHGYRLAERIGELTMCGGQRAGRVGRLPLSQDHGDQGFGRLLVDPLGFRARQTVLSAYSRRRTLPPEVDRDPGSLPRRDHRTA